MKERNIIITNIIDEYFTNLLNKLNFNYISYHKEKVDKYNYLTRDVHFLKLTDNLTIKLVEKWESRGGSLQDLTVYKMDFFVGENTDIFDINNIVFSIDCISIYTDNINLVGKLTTREMEIEFSYTQLLYNIRMYIAASLGKQEYYNRKKMK